MRKIRSTLSFLAIAGALTAVTVAVHAQESRQPPGPMMRDGMMGGNQMMERMNRMMEQCSAMMQGSSRSDRPDDQQRRNSPTVPERER